jgi:hypothetical protein
MTVRLHRAIEVALAATLLGAAPAAASEAQPQLGLMGTIPIYWGEAAQFEDHINGAGEAHWARGQLEEQFELLPLATLNEASLAPLGYLLLAQPRALTPEENVALDGWVRGGGRLLLFADPMMTGHSRFALGDPRRPQDVTLLSPLLTHWNLPLFFDDAQPGEPRMVEVDDVAIPVRLAGRFVPKDEGEGCVFAAEDVLARCRIGEGKVLVLADAAMLDLHEAPDGAPAALAWLCQQLFGDSGEKAGHLAAALDDPEKDSESSKLKFESGGG